MLGNNMFEGGLGGPVGDSLKDQIVKWGEPDPDAPDPAKFVTTAATAVFSANAAAAAEAEAEAEAKKKKQHQTIFFVAGGVVAVGALLYFLKKRD